MTNIIKKPAFKETPIWDSICKEYRAKRQMPKFENWAPNCMHTRIEQDEPRDEGGAYYRCANPKCHVLVDPQEWEYKHGKNWNWYEDTEK